MPIRTCIVTKQRREQSELLRFVIRDKQLIFDTNRVLPGRGGYVVYEIGAIGKLEKMKPKVEYLLHVKGITISTEAISEQIQKIEKEH